MVRRPGSWKGGCLRLGRHEVKCRPFAALAGAPNPPNQGKANDMSILPLTPHPTGLRGPIEELSVQVERAGPSAISVKYRLVGDLGLISIAPSGEGSRTDGLWRNTCFEAFARADGDPGYLEFNFAPSGDWAAYQFKSYRTGMADFDCKPPDIQTFRAGADFLLCAEIGFEENSPFQKRGMIRMAFTAVIALANGERRYWALAHPANEPDFHHPAGFVYELDGKELA